MTRHSCFTVGCVTISYIRHAYLCHYLLFQCELYVNVKHNHSDILIAQMYIPMKAIYNFL